MTFTFSQLKDEYTSDLAEMKFTRSTAINATASRLVDLWKAGKYSDVPEKTGIPAVWIAASFEREASSDFRDSPAQGDPWNRKSVHVPANRGPFSSWEEAALDAYHLDGLDKVGQGHWSWELCCYYGELFNGPGYHSHGIPSPYLWGGTNIQKPGKYVRDGVFDPNVMDSQLGIIPIMRRMIDMEPALDFTKHVPTTPPPVIPPPSPKPKPPVKPPIHPNTGSTAGIGAALMTFLHNYGWAVALVAIAVIAVLIYLHSKDKPNQSPKAIPPEPQGATP